jgi:eukaryotic-like serine/threonine-protein kinase
MHRGDVLAIRFVIENLMGVGGMPAFVGAHPMAVLSKLLFEAPPRLKTYVADIPEELDARVWQLMAKAKDDRPKDGRMAALRLRSLSVGISGTQVSVTKKNDASPGIFEHAT